MRTVAMGDLHAQHGFIAIASRETAHVFGQWRKDAQQKLMFISLFGLIACLTLAFYQRAAGRLQRKAQAAEQAMRASNQRFERVANTIPCVLFDLEFAALNEARILYVGAYCQTLLGMPPQAVIDNPQSVLARIHRKDQQQVIAAHNQAFANRSSFECEFRYFARPNDQRWQKISATISPGSVDKKTSGAVLCTTSRIASSGSTRCMSWLTAIR